MPTLETPAVVVVGAAVAERGGGRRVGEERKLTWEGGEQDGSGAFELEAGDALLIPTFWAADEGIWEG